MSDCVPLVGDSGAMRELAGALRRTASAIDGYDSAAWPKATALTFTGPAATRLKSALGDWHRDLDRAATILTDTADLLVRSAAELDAERARLERRERLERLEHRR